MDNSLHFHESQILICKMGEWVVLDQLFSNLSVQQNQLEGLLKRRSQSLTPRFSRALRVGLISCLSNKVLGDADAIGPSATL